METRNIKIDLNTAKEWYEGSDETLKKLALQAYKEEELIDSLPNSWEEFCSFHRIKEGEAYYSVSYGGIVTVNNSQYRHPSKDIAVLPNVKSVEAHLALFKLEQLRDCYRDGWKPDWGNIELHKYVIYNLKNKIIFNTDIDGTNHFLSFPKMELCEKFYTNFIDLIEVAKDLI